MVGKATLMAESTAGARGGAHVALVAVGVSPGRVMRVRPDLGMAGVAGIHLVTHHTAFAVPRRPNAVRLAAPQNIVRRRHHLLVAFAAGLFRMAHAAHVVRLDSLIAVTPHPVDIMIRRRRIAIHVHVAGRAIHPPPVGVIPNPHDCGSRQFRNLRQGLIQDIPMTIRASILQRVCVDERARLGPGRLGRVQRGQHIEIAEFVALTAGGLGNLLGVDPIVVTVGARGMRGAHEASVQRFAVALRTAHGEFIHMQIMAEIQDGFLVLPAPGRKGDDQKQGDDRQAVLKWMARLQYFTSMEPRAR